MKKISYKAVFNRKKKLNKEGKGLVQIECYLNGKRKYLSTGIKVEPIYWNGKYNIIKNNKDDSVELNRLISQQIRSLEDFEFKQIEKNGTFSLAEINGFNYNNNSSGNSFLDFIKESIESNITVSKDTIKQHQATYRRLKNFSNNLAFEDLTFDFVKKFDDYLRNMNLHVNTIAKYHKVVKTYINLAIKKKRFKSENYPYSQFKVKKIKTKRTFLTLEEVAACENIEFTEETEHIGIVRDMFVFSCYTGLRYSDVQSLTNRNILKEGKDYYIEIRMNKTKDFVRLPVSLLFNGKAVDIIKKYEEDFPDKFLFPRLSNQKANLKLKVVSLVARINKDLTFHISRHTFGTNLAAATSDQFVIKELMGHSDIKTSMIYIHTSQEQIKNKLKNTNWD